MNICLFVSTQEFDPVSILIREKTECAWSHVGFYNLDDNTTFSAMCDGKGVAFRPVGKNQKIMLLDVPGRTRTDLNLAYTLARSQEGKSYNELDILGLALGRDWCTADRFICSTLVFWAFQKALCPLLGMWAIPLDHFTPRDILLSPYIAERKAL